jgi:protein-tyrosine phosphatase
MASQVPAHHRTDVRIPELVGALNFRDMGGYATNDGRTVRWNRLYRSGTTHQMTSGDLQHITSRGIRYACDLRTNSERRHYRNRLHDVPEIEYWCHDHDRLPGDLNRLIRRPDARPEHSRAIMLTVYRELPYDFREAYRELLTRLSNGQIPLVFNCTAGKDRTGVAAALVLTALGVPRRVIQEDYLLTELFYDQCCDVMVKDGGNQFFDGVERHLWEPMMRAESAYLDAMFDRLDAAHGSAESYLRDELGMHAGMIDRLRSHLLE